MAPVKLSPDEAHQRLQEIESAVQDVGTRQQDMRLRAEEMVQSSWHGGKARAFGEAMQTHDQDLTAINQKLNELVEQARQKVGQIDAEAS